jgi:L-ascorbate metabolism protein UlaG (beta-lactamase superfamily)
MFEGSKIIYTDPWDLKNHEPKADIILVTHGHYDHCVEADIERLLKPGTDVVTTSDCAAKLSKIKAKIIKPGDVVTVQGVKIEAVPAYNINKQFHPKSNGWVGFVFTLDGERIYQAGDTDLIPEMKDIKADVALLPVGGTYTMTAKEAAEAADWIKPRLAIPMHYGKNVGSLADAEEFKRLAKCETRILKPNS